MKKCCTCHEEKVLSEFARNWAKPDQRQARCRECTKEWYKANRKAHRAKTNERTRRIRAENGRRIVAYLKAHPCVDCGEPDHVVLDFDHLRDKTHNVSNMKDLSWWRIRQEIAKCEVVCANCHRRRTARRGKYYKYLDA